MGQFVCPVYFPQLHILKKKSNDKANLRYHWHMPLNIEGVLFTITDPQADLLFGIFLPLIVGLPFTSSGGWLWIGFENPF